MRKSLNRMIITCGRAFGGGLPQPFFARSFSSMESIPTVKNELNFPSVTGEIDSSWTSRMFFQRMQHKGRKEIVLPMRDLKRLFQMCENVDDLRFAVGGVDLFQRKRQDFSEEINSLFIKLCIRFNSPQTAATIFLKYKNRISAWTTITALNRLLKSLSERNEVVLIIDMLKVLVSKGVRPNKDSFEIILSCEEFKTDAEQYSTLVELWSASGLDTNDVHDLKNRYPAPSTPTAVFTTIALDTSLDGNTVTIDPSDGDSDIGGNDVLKPI